MGQDADAYIDLVKQRFSNYKITEAVEAGSHTFDVVASKTRLAISKFGIEQSYFVFSKFESIDDVTFRAYSAATFEYCSRSAFPFPPPGFGRTLVSFPVALVPNIDDSMRRSVASDAAPRHFSKFEFPVIVELESGALRYLEKTPMWGSAYFRGFRKRADALLQP